MQCRRATPRGASKLARLTKLAKLTKLAAVTASASLAVTVASPRTAAAQEEGPVSRAAVAENVGSYYRSERSTAFTFIGIGAVSAGAGAALVAHGTDFSRGLGVSMIAIGALEVIGSTFYAFQVGAELDHYSGLLARDPAQFKADERAHIHGTTSRFFWYRTSELVLALAGAGVATYGFASDRDVWKGVGLGVGVEAATFFVLDAFGSSRAHEYEDRLGRFEPSVAFSIGGREAGGREGGRERPWSLDVGGRF